MSPPRRLAPRSGNQFRIGPPFGETTSKYTILDSNRNPVEPQVHARLDRGFDLVGENWIGYKRNYFTLVASFFFKNRAHDIIHSHSFHYVGEDNVAHPIQAFRISLTSFSPEDLDSRVTLVQHTAKRDRGPQNAPPKYYVIPGNLPEHDTMKQVANIRNDDKIEKYKRLFYLSPAEHEHLATTFPKSTLSNYPQGVDICFVARYERIQFSCVGEGLRKSATTNNKHFILVIQLSGLTEEGTDVVLATSQSPPLVVRGRSPSSYTDAVKRDSKKENVHMRVPGNFGSSRSPLGVNRNIQNLGGKRSEKVKSRSFVARQKVESPFRDSANVFLNLASKVEEEPALSVQPTQAAESTNVFSSPQAISNKAVCPASHESPESTIEIPDKQSSPFPRDMPQENSYIIPQDENYPFASNSGSSSFADDEPMNVNHTQFRSSIGDLEHALALYEADKPNLDTSDEYSFLSTSSASSSAPIPFSALLKTSTPLQISTQRAAMKPCLGKNIFPEIERCKHGFKKRTHRDAVQYSIEDALENVSDESFTLFKNKLDFYKQRIHSRPPSPLSLAMSADFEGIIH